MVFWLTLIMWGLVYLFTGWMIAKDEKWKMRLVYTFFWFPLVRLELALKRITKQREPYEYKLDEEERKANKREEDLRRMGVL